MIETRIRVITAADGTAWVRTTEDSGCGGCGARSSCAVSGLGKYFARHQRAIPVACDSTVRAGDELVATVTESELLKAGLMAYLLPAVLAVLGASLAALRGLGDAGTVAGMAAGVALGLLCARLLAKTSRLHARRNPIPISEGEAP
ncbi:MAG: SoxR reducing system RseC family protein [Thiobacillaceae bacterium]|jgi:sigma-E factor negative regulatory protein RseC